MSGGALLAFTSCSGPAEVSAPEPNTQTANRCRSLVSALPKQNNDHSEREVTPSSRLTTAWGDPPITLACGVAKPNGLKRDSKCWEVNGVGWYAQQRSDDYRFTTIGRRAYVQVTVPNKYAPQADELVDLASAIKKHDPVRKKCV